MWTARRTMPEAQAREARLAQAELPAPEVRAEPAGRPEAEAQAAVLPAAVAPAPAVRAESPGRPEAEVLVVVQAAVLPAAEQLAWRVRGVAASQGRPRRVACRTPAVPAGPEAPPRAGKSMEVPRRMLDSVILGAQTQVIRALARGERVRAAAPVLALGAATTEAAAAG